jgi:hypothetical protein
VSCFAAAGAWRSLASPLPGSEVVSGSFDLQKVATLSEQKYGDMWRFRYTAGGHKPREMSIHLQAYLNKVARQLNERPREILQFETPAERFNACVASTV